MLARARAISCAALAMSLLACSTTPAAEPPPAQSAPLESVAPAPIDPQQVQDQDEMTWQDYRPIPDKNWADRSLKPQRGFRIALVAIDFSDQPFVMTRPMGLASPHSFFASARLMIVTRVGTSDSTGVSVSMNPRPCATRAPRVSKSCPRAA